MSRVVWKYVVPVDGQSHEITMPVGARIVHVACQGGDRGVVSMWAEVNPPADTAIRDFCVFGTGHLLPLNGRHVGTAPTADGALVWHLYEAVNDHHYELEDS